MMKKITALFLFGILLNTGCKKEESAAQRGETLPFENEHFKLEFVSNSVPASIRDIHFMDQAIGIVVTYDGQIFRTKDGGSTWVLKYTSPTPDQQLHQILFTDPQTGYVVGGSLSCNGNGCVPPGGILLKTTDGGNSWQSMLQIKEVEFISVAQSNIGDLFAIANGKGGFIYKSSNAGNDWVLIDSVSFSLNRINFTANTGIITGTGGTILSSQDKGSTWSTSTMGGSQFFTDITFENGMIYCLSNYNTIYQSNDNGTSWSLYYTASHGILKIVPLSANTFFTFGSGWYTGGCFGRSYGAVRHSSDDGKQWTETEFSDTDPIRFCSFTSPTEGYVVARTQLLRVTVK